MRTLRKHFESFLGDYLVLSYGQRVGHKVRSATPALRQILARNRPRVPAAVRRQHPRILHVQCEPGTGAVSCDALVDDGRLTYSVTAQLERRGSWLVTQVE